jgi:hypothetical protein
LEKIIDYYIEIYKANPDLIFFIANELRGDANHFIELAKSENLVSYFSVFIDVVEKEMNSGRIRRVPLEYLGCQIFSQLIFPFIAKPVISEVMLNSNYGFDAFLDGWKSYILDEVKRNLAV